MSQFGQPPLAAYLPLRAGQNLADLPDKAAALTNLGTLSTSDIMMNSVPLGTIIAYWGSVSPVGYLPCNGQTINSGTFPDLVTFLGGTTSAVMPDMRGEFLRGWDNGRGVDTGRALKTAQGGTVESHTHQPLFASGTPLTGPNLGIINSGSDQRGGSGTPTYANSGGGQPYNSMFGGTETRPRNVAVQYCMKAYGAAINASTANIANVLSELSNTTKINQFSAVMSTTGYQKLSSGLIIQWGQTTSSGTAINNITITFPIVFPNGCLNGSVTLMGAVSGSYSVLLNGGVTTTGMQATASVSGSMTGGIGAHWMAIGY